MPLEGPLLPREGYETMADGGLVDGRVLVSSRRDAAGHVGAGERLHRHVQLSPER